MKQEITIKGIKFNGIEIEEVKICEDFSVSELNKILNNICDIVKNNINVKETKAENENNSKEEIEQQSSVNEPMVGQCPHPSAKESLEKEVKIDSYSLVLNALQRKYFERVNNELKNGEELKVDYLDLIINLVGIKYDYIYECPNSSLKDLENDYLLQFINQKIDEIEDKWME